MNFCQFEKSPLEKIKKKKLLTKINKKQTQKPKNKKQTQKTKNKKFSKKSKNDDYKHILTEMNQINQINQRISTIESNQQNTSKIENDIQRIKDVRNIFEKNMLKLQTQMNQVLTETSELRKDINKIKENFGQLDTKNIDKTSELSVSLNPSETLIISDDEMITEPIVEKANTITIPIGDSEFRTGHDQFLTKAIQKGGIGLVRQNTEVKALLTQHNEEQKTISTSVKETLDEAN